MVQIYENFLPFDEFINLKEIILSNNFPWFFQIDISTPNSRNLKLNRYGFSHVFFKDGKINSDAFCLIQGLIDKLKIISNTNHLAKARADMTMYDPHCYMHEPHVDLQQPHIVFVLYMTNSTAPTVIFNEKRSTNGPVCKKNTILQKVYPKENQMVMFDGDYFHTGYSPYDENRRVLLNFNFI